MSLELEGFDLILTHGPPLVGKEKFCSDSFSQTHKIIYPRQLYKENSKFGIRDVALVAYKKLKEGHKVIILDTNESRKTRESYVRLLKKKFGHLKVAIVSIVPRYGCQQLFWSREFHMAQESLHGDTIHRSCEDDELILQWFDRSSDTSVVYKQGTVDAVKDSEGDTVYRDDQGLVATSAYKFEVPALFIQWECLSSLQNDDGSEKFLSECVEVLNNWSEAVLCGRIIVLCDGTLIRTGERSRSQQISDIEEALRKITSKFDKSPVYVYHTEKPTEAGSYVLPPNPGVLAYLQRRHCLNLTSKQTVYMFESTAHMKMAENAGVRHVKASRIISHPSLITSGHIATIPAIPEALKHLTLQMEVEPQKRALLPLYKKAEHFGEGRIHVQLGYGRSEYLFAQNWESVKRYQELYAGKAKRIDESGSDMSPVKSVKKDKSRTSLGTASNTSISGTSLGSRDLPKWMMSKEDSTASNSSLKSSLSSSSSITEKKVRKSVYVMSEKELVEMATEILRQAGKTDMIKTMQDKEMRRTTETKSGTPENKAHDQHRKRRRSKGKSVATDVSETPSSICPKMEVEDFDNVDVPVDDFDQEESQRIDTDTLPRKKTKVSTEVSSNAISSTKSNVRTDNRTANLESKNDKRKEDLDFEGSVDLVEPTMTSKPNVVTSKPNVATSKPNVATSKANVRHVTRSDRSREIASSVLDDFMDTTVHRKPSPKKKTQDLLSAANTRSREVPESPERGQIPTKCTDNRAEKVNRKAPRHTPDLSILDDIFL